MKTLKKLLPILLTIILAFTLVSCSIDVDDESNSNNGDKTTTVINATVTVKTETAPTTVQPLVEVLEKIRPTVVEVYSSVSGGTSAGSGIVYSFTKADNNESIYYILTCHHVIEDAKKIAVKDISGNSFSAYLIGGDPKSDIAVIGLSSNNNDFTNANLKATTLRAKQEGQDLVKFGEEVVAIGNPLGTLGGTVTRGIISTVEREITIEGQKMNLIQTDCAINSGNSGGALYSVDGQLVGVVNAGYSGSVEGLNFAIPSDYAMQIANSLISTYTGEGYGYVTGRASIKVADVTNVFWGVSTAGYDMFFNTKSSATSYYTSIAYVDEKSVYGQNLSVGQIVTEVSYEGKTLSVTLASELSSFINTLELTAGKTLTFKVKSSVSSNDVTTVNIIIPQYIYKP